MIDGVCGGFAAYFSIDPTLVRLLWVLLSIFGGSGIVLYIAGMILMPKEELAPEAAPVPPQNHDHNTKLWGFLLIGVGLFWLMGNLGFPAHLWGFPWHFGVPLLLILAGVAFLFGGRNYLAGTPAPAQAMPGTEPGPAAPPVANHRLYRSRTDKKLLGVCGGLGAHLNIDPVILRLLFVVAALASFGFVFILYIVMGMIVPREPEPAAVPVL
jgi:phage shock protein PspC (stress-responsive transcriptional regulator)